MIDETELEAIERLQKENDELRKLVTDLSIRLQNPEPKYFWGNLNNG